MDGQDIGLMLFFVLWSAFVVFTIYKDGWRRLAKRYRTVQPASGKRWRFQGVTVGWSHYGSSLTLTTNADGLFMESFWIERFWHPRLFIPWQDFHHATIKDRLLWRTLEVQVGNPKLATLRLSPEIFARSEGRRVLEAALIGTNVPNG